MGFAEGDLKISVEDEVGDIIRSIHYRFENLWLEGLDFLDFGGLSNTPK